MRKGEKLEAALVGQIHVHDTVHIGRDPEAIPVSRSTDPSLGDLLGLAISARQ